MNIYKAAGVIIENRKLLVARSRNKNMFVSPGGKLESGENAEQALIRELREEFKIGVQEVDLNKINSYSAPAAGNESVTVIMDVFFVKKYTGIITPDSEIEELAWIDSQTAHAISLGSIFEHEVIPYLVKSNLID